jgi:hypothetical protein
VSCTYTPGSGTPKDRIRFLIGDTDVLAQENLRLEDEEINDALTLATGSPTPTTSAALYRVGADCADVLAAKFARVFEGASSGPGPSRTRAQELRATARELRQRASAGAVPFAGGISQADKAGRAADPDRVPSTFRKGMLDNPDAQNPQSR